MYPPPEILNEDGSIYLEHGYESPWPLYDYIPQSVGDELLSGREIGLAEAEKFLCDNVKVEFYSFNAITETKTYLKCELLIHGDEFYRVHYYFGDDTIPYYRNDDVPLNSDEAKNVTFIQNYYNT